MSAALRPDGPNSFETSDNPTIRDYDARRCHTCRCRHPSFGFGPPMTRPGTKLWACFEHWKEVDAMLRHPQQEAGTECGESQPSLL